MIYFNSGQDPIVSDPQTTSLLDGASFGSPLSGDPENGIVYGYADLSGVQGETIQRVMHFSPICCPEVHDLERELGLTFQQCITEERLDCCLDRTTTLYYRSTEGAVVVITTGSIEEAPLTCPVYLLDEDVKEALLAIKEMAEELGALPPQVTFNLSRREAELGNGLLARPTIELGWPARRSVVDENEG